MAKKKAFFHYRWYYFGRRSIF